MKEYKLMLDRFPIGSMHVDEGGYFHLNIRENGSEYISVDPIDIDQVTDVLLEEGPDPGFIRFAVKDVYASEDSELRNLAISAYSKYGKVKARIYVHDVVAMKFAAYINVDSIMVRTLKEISSPQEEVHEDEPAPEYTLAERLTYFRKRARLSGYELAKVAGISPTTVNGIERGRIMNPSFTSLESICGALEITLAEFFSINMDKEQDMNISLVEEIRHLTSTEQAELAKELRMRRHSDHQ